MASLLEACRTLAPGYGPFHLDASAADELREKIARVKGALYQAEELLRASDDDDVRNHRIFVSGAAEKVIEAVESALPIREALREACELFASDESVEREARVIVAGGARP